jgi:predicted Zn finger-like uncharacterized protein
MRVSCPNCSTEYDVPDAALAGRSRKLRCERCGHKWRTSAPAAPFAAAAPAWPVAPPATALPPVPEAPAFTPPPPPAYTPPPFAAVPPPAGGFPPPPVAAVAPPPAYTAPVFAAPPPPAGGFPQPPIAAVAPPPVPPEPPSVYEPTAPVWAAMPEPPATFAPVEPRQFGKPVDETALAEVQQAVAHEQKWQPLLPIAPEPAAAPPPEPEAGAEASEPLPNFLTAAGADETLMLTAPYAASVSGDRFAELVYAARNKAIEVEPEPVPPPPVRTSNTPLFVLLVLAFVIACILVEHTNIARFFPASARFFALLGLK